MALKKNGERCRAYALWGSSDQKCSPHTYAKRSPSTGYRPPQKTQYTPCECEAYAWKHRPGGGLCRWPDPPEYRRTTPAGTHAYPRLRHYSLLRRFLRGY